MQEILQNVSVMKAFWSQSVQFDHPPRCLLKYGVIKLLTLESQMQSYGHENKIKLLYNGFPNNWPLYCLVPGGAVLRVFPVLLQLLCCLHSPRVHFSWTALTKHKKWFWEHCCCQKYSLNSCSWGENHFCFA